jgi:anthranilate synthase component 1
MDHAITIRTLVGEGKTAYVQSGAGIVYDSVPETEFLEVDNKARALMRSLGVKS